MTETKSNGQVHRRFNPLTGQWVLVSPQRLARPWSGQVDEQPHEAIPAYEPGCPLCPGNKRTGSRSNPEYRGTFVFNNDFAALQAESPAGADTALVAADPLIRSSGAGGIARVICFSPAHDRSLPELPLDAIRGVIDRWHEQIDALGQDFVWVQVFENKGAMMGSSQPHPHGQIWASDFVPTAVATRDRHLQHYFAENRSNLLIDYLQRELQLDERIVVNSEHWTALVPYWAAWPFETMLLPKRHVPRFAYLHEDEKQDLAVTLKELLTRYDNLFECAFPYSMGWHYAPFNAATDHWQLNAVFYPPLLRSASVRKFMVGYEMLAETQRDLTPEQAAQQLREVPTLHYRHR